MPEALGTDLGSSTKRMKVNCSSVRKKGMPECRALGNISSTRKQNRETERKMRESQSRVNASPRSAWALLINNNNKKIRGTTLPFPGTGVNETGQTSFMTNVSLGPT